MVMITFFFFRIFYFISPILFLPSFPFFSSMIMIIIFHIFYHSCRAVPLQCLLYSASSPFLKKQKEKKMRKKNCNFLVFHFLFLPAQKQESTEFHRNKLSQLSPGDYRRRVVDHSLFFLLPLIIWIPLFPLSLFSCMSLFPYLVALILV